MLIDFFLHLKASRLPVSIKEFLALLEALQARLVGASLDDFYLLARAILIKDEALYDRFDRAFGEYFKGVEALPGLEAMIPEDWLELAAKRHLSEEDRLKLLLAEDIPPEALRSKDQKTAIPPLHGALLKNEQDVHLFERLIFMARHNR